MRNDKAYSHNAILDWHSRITKSKSYMRSLSINGNSKMMHCWTLFNMPYYYMPMVKP